MPRQVTASKAFFHHRELSRALLGSAALGDWDAGPHRTSGKEGGFMRYLRTRVALTVGAVWL